MLLLQKDYEFSIEVEPKNREERIAERFKTDWIIRPKYGKEIVKELIKPAYSTTPGNKYTCRHVCDRGRQFDDNGKQFIDKDRLRRIPERRKQLDKTVFCSPESEYLKNNHLGIKFGLGNQDMPRFQLKRISIRNYRPKILNQEINLGMWI